MSELNWTPAEVAEFYDGSSPMADKYFFGYQHLGYWYDENDDTPLEEASKRLTRKIVDTLGLRPGGTLLDAGCGTGVAGRHTRCGPGGQDSASPTSPVEGATGRGWRGRVATAQPPAPDTDARRHQPRRQLHDALGAALDEVDRHSLESRRHRGLFLCGEMLDAFGPIGGHNFAWAWSTGRTAGLGAAGAV